MKIEEKEIQKKAEQALLAVLKEIPFIKIDEIRKVDQNDSKLSQPDLLVKLKLPVSKQTLIVDIKRSGQPRLARQSVNQLLLYRESFRTAYGVFVAPYISKSAAEICTRENIGYMDLSGNCLLTFQQIYIRREGKPNIFSEKRDLRSLYSPKSSRMLRILINNPGKKWKIQQLADESEISLGQVFNVKKLLMDREWIQIDSNGFSLGQPGDLLNEWEKNYTFRRNNVHYLYSIKSQLDIELEIMDACTKYGINYAFTGFTAALRIAPSVRSKVVMAYIENGVEQLIEATGLKEVSSGANTLLLNPYDKGIFYGTRTVDDIRIVSPVQIYLDLQGFRGRGQEAAEAVFEKDILPKW